MNSKKVGNWCSSKPQWIDSGQHPNPTQLNLFPTSESPWWGIKVMCMPLTHSLHQSIKNYYYWNKQTVSYLLLRVAVFYSKHFKYYRISSFRHQKILKVNLLHRKHRLGCSFGVGHGFSFLIAIFTACTKWKGFKLLVGTGKRDLS